MWLPSACRFQLCSRPRALPGELSDAWPTLAAPSLSNVKVTLVNEGTSVSRDAKTNENGDYDFVEVPVGTYRLEFDMTGFKKNVRRGVNLDINQVSRST